MKGVGKKYAGLIVEAFGDETLRVIEREPPHRLEGVKGIGKKRAEKIVRTVTEQRSYMRLLAHLKPLGVGNAVAMKLFKEFGHNASHIAKTTPPYRATTIPGIGFRTADLLAKAVGQAFDSDDRIRAAAVYVLDEQCQIQGHTWLVLAEWVSATHKLLSNRDDYQPSLNPAVIEEKLLADPEISKTVEIESWEGQQYVAPPGDYDDTKRPLQKAYTSELSIQARQRMFPWIPPYWKGCRLHKWKQPKASFRLPPQF